MGGIYALRRIRQNARRRNLATFHGSCQQTFQSLPSPYRIFCTLRFGFVKTNSRNYPLLHGIVCFSRTKIPEGVWFYHLGLELRLTHMTTFGAGIRRSGGDTTTWLRSLLASTGRQKTCELLHFVIVDERPSPPAIFGIFVALAW